MDNNNPIIDTPQGRFIPSKIAQRCPVCNGFGSLKYGSKTCQACEGKGYILIPAIREMDGRNYDKTHS